MVGERKCFENARAAGLVGVLRQERDLMMHWLRIARRGEEENKNQASEANVGIGVAPSIGPRWCHGCRLHWCRLLLRYVVFLSPPKLRYS